MLPARGRRQDISAPVDAVVGGCKSLAVNGVEACSPCDASAHVCGEVVPSAGLSAPPVSRAVVQDGAQRVPLCAGKRRTFVDHSAEQLLLPGIAQHDGLAFVHRVALGTYDLAEQGEKPSSVRAEIAIATEREVIDIAGVPSAESFCERGNASVEAVAEQVGQRR